MELGCPGLCSRLEALPGQWLPPPEAPVYAKPSGRVFTRLVYFLPKRHLRISFRIWFSVVNDKFEIFSCAYHCGPSDDTEAHDFRFCSPGKGKGDDHFHLRGHERDGDRGHLPLWKADPPLDKNPLSFMSLIESFVTTKALPLRVKK